MALCKVLCILPLRAVFATAHWVVSCLIIEREMFFAGKKQLSVDGRSRSVFQWSLGTDSTFQLSAWHCFAACSEGKDPNPILGSSLISLYDFQTKWCDYLNLELSLLHSIKPSLVAVTFGHKGMSEISLWVVGWWSSTSFFASYSHSPVLCCAGAGLNPCPDLCSRQ